METAVIKSPLGYLKLQASDKGLQRCSILNQEEAISCLNCGISPFLEEVIQQLHQYFDGERETFDVEFDLQGTAFQKKVWMALTTIAYGKTLSYSELAIQLGDLNAIRAVASANGKNPIGIIIPCHRVIGSDGSLTGFAWGIDKKQWLLEHESNVKQLSLF